MQVGTIRTANFAFLGVHDPNLTNLGGLAGRYFRDDPPTCLIKAFSGVMPSGPSPV
jgi:hypothetical protein